MGASESTERRDSESEEEGDDDDYSEDDERVSSQDRGRARPVATLGSYVQVPHRASPSPSHPRTPSPTASTPTVPLPSPPASPISPNPNPNAYPRAQNFPLPLATTYPAGGSNRSPRGGGAGVHSHNGGEVSSREPSKSPRAQGGTDALVKALTPPGQQSKPRTSSPVAHLPPHSSSSSSKVGGGRPLAIPSEKQGHGSPASGGSPGGSPRRPPPVPSVFYPSKSPPLSPHAGGGVAASPFTSARDSIVEFYFVRHAESSNNLQPHLISGRATSCNLTPTGKQQASALGRFLNETPNLVFDAVYSSPSERTKATAFAICQELGISEDSVEFSEDLQELSQGQWEGKARAEVYTPNIVGRINSQQPDFRAPGGESQRQVEFRMVEFINTVVLPRFMGPPEVSGDFKSWVMENGSGVVGQTPIVGFSPKAHAIADGEGKVSEERVATSIAAVDFQFELGSPEGPVSGRQVSELPPASGSPKQRRTPSGGGGKSSGKPVTSRVLIVTHAMAIKCLLRGLTGADHHMMQRTAIDNSSMTVIRHLSHRGWALQKVNDTAHLTFNRAVANPTEG